MFSGLVEEVGECLWLRQAEAGTQLAVASPLIGAGIRTGDSVAINGCCLTAAAARKNHLSFDLLQETLDRTNLRGLRPGAPVNLERALAATARLGGHFVQGHVDCTAKILKVGDREFDRVLTIELGPAYASYVVEKGSIAVNGVSLTVASIAGESLSVWIIPHTRNATNLGKLAVGDDVNLEFDILAKYVERFLEKRGPEKTAATK